MKTLKLVLALLVVLSLVEASAFAQAEYSRNKGVATKICGVFMTASTATALGAAPTSIDCEIDGYSDSVAANGFTDVTGEAAVGTSGGFCFDLSANENDTDYANLKCTCANSGAAAWLASLNNTGVNITDRSYQMSRLAGEGTNTLTGTTNAIAVDDQFNNGFAIVVYDYSTRAVEARSCITDSANSGEIFTTAEDLSSLVDGNNADATLRDYYVVVPDAGCLALRPTVANRTLDVAATGEAGLDFSNVNGTLDAAEVGANALTDAKVADDLTLSNVSGGGGTTGQRKH